MDNYPKTNSFPYILRVLDKDFIRDIVYSKLHQPIAYVQILDENGNTVNLATCESFDISTVKNTFYNEFNITLSQANSWNPRSIYENLLYPDIRKRILIYYGHTVGNKTVYELIMIGIPAEAPEEYQYGSSNLIKVVGHSLGYQLDKIIGTYDVDDSPNYTGYTQGLVEYWLNQANLTKYFLNYSDFIYIDDETINYSNVIAGISTFKQILGPTVEMYCDCEGIFYMLDYSEPTAERVEFAFTDDNIHSTSITNNSKNVITVANISGNDDVSSLEQSADSDILAKYGRNVYTISSGFINTADIAAKLATDVLKHNGWLTEYHLNIPFNPYIRLNSVVSVNSELVAIKDVVFSVKAYSHSYRRGQNCGTTIKGHMI